MSIASEEYLRRATALREIEALGHCVIERGPGLGRVITYSNTADVVMIDEWYWDPWNSSIAPWAGRWCRDRSKHRELSKGAASALARAVLEDVKVKP